jgi:hypothetical protein
MVIAVVMSIVEILVVGMIFCQTPHHGNLHLRRPVGQDNTPVVNHSEGKLVLRAGIHDAYLILWEIQYDGADLAHQVGSDKKIVRAEETFSLARNKKMVRINHATKKDSSIHPASPFDERSISLRDGWRRVDEGTEFHAEHLNDAFRNKGDIRASIEKSGGLVDVSTGEESQSIARESHNVPFSIGERSETALVWILARSDGAGTLAELTHVGLPIGNETKRRTRRRVLEGSVFAAVAIIGLLSLIIKEILAACQDGMWWIIHDLYG